MGRFVDWNVLTLHNGNRRDIEGTAGTVHEVQIALARRLAGCCCSSFIVDCARRPSARYGVQCFRVGRVAVGC